MLYINEHWPPSTKLKLNYIRNKIPNSKDKSWDFLTDERIFDVFWRINNMVWIFTLNITIKNVYIICIWTGNFFMVQFTTSFYLASNNSIGTATNKKRCPLNLNFLPVFLRSRNHLRTFYERMIKLFLTRYLYVGWTRFAQWTQPETGTCSIFLQCC